MSSGSSWAEDTGRARWGDRGVGVGHLWEPSEDGLLAPQRLPPVLLRAGAPGWLQRELRGTDGGRDR